jgi:DNA polymerase delta subunit 3
MTDAPAAEETQTEASQPEKPDVPESDDNKPTVTVSNGRRRGKRRVMKKKKVKDEDGYLGMSTYPATRDPG